LRVLFHGGFTIARVMKLSRIEKATQTVLADGRHKFVGSVNSGGRAKNNFLNPVYFACLLSGPELSPEVLTANELPSKTKGKICISYYSRRCLQWTLPPAGLRSL
jgi:hypothetical protein